MQKTAKRGSAKTPPKYRKHKRSGQAIVTLSGRDIYLGPHGTKASKSEYDRVICEWLANGRTLAEPEQQVTVKALIAMYWAHAKTYYVKHGEPTAELGGIKIALKAVKERYGNTSVDDFGPLALEAIRQGMVDRGNARSYINQNVNRIRRCFKWGVSKEHVPPAVYQRLQALDGLKRGKSKAKETARILPVDDAIVDATIARCSRIVADMVRIQRLTGCRPGEVRTMRADEVDRSFTVWRYTPGSHKMEHKDRCRVILIGPKAQEILLPYLIAGGRCCFEKPRGGMFHRWNYNEAIYRACDRAFPAPESIRNDRAKLLAWRRKHRWAPNRLRHAAGTAVRQEFGLEAAQNVLGHASADVTQIYAERDMVKASEVMAKVG